MEVLSLRLCRNCAETERELSKSISLYLSECDSLGFQKKKSLFSPGLVLLLLRDRESIALLRFCSDITRFLHSLGMESDCWYYWGVYVS